MSSNEDSNSKKDVTKLIKEASDVKKSNEELNKKADSLERGIKDMVGIMNNLPKFKINAPEQSTDSSNATRVNPTAGNTQYVDGLSATLYSKADVDNKFLTKSESASLEKKINDTVNNLVSDVKAYIDTVEDDLKSYIDGSRSVRVSKTRT